MFQIVKPKDPPAAKKPKGAKNLKKAADKATTVPSKSHAKNKTANKGKAKASDAQTQGEPSTDVIVKPEETEIVLSPQGKRRRLDDDQAPVPVPENQARADHDDDINTSIVIEPEMTEGGEETTYRKVVEGNMRAMCLTEDCRRHITIRHFDGQPPLRGE